MTLDCRTCRTQQISIGEWLFGLGKCDVCKGIKERKRMGCEEHGKDFLDKLGWCKICTENMKGKGHLIKRVVRRIKRNEHQK